MLGYSLVVNCRCTVCTSSMDLQGLEESSLGIGCRRGSFHADMVVSFFGYSPANNLKQAIIGPPLKGVFAGGPMMAQH